MRRSLLLLILVIGCRKAGVEVRPDDKQSGPPRVTCKLVEPITTATIPARCDLAIDKVVRVPAGSSLDIGAGAKLTFAKGAGLVLDGGTLRARGTTEEPIVFTSATRVAGDWTGIVFTHRPFDLSPRFAKLDAGPDAPPPPPPNSESIVEHIVVEYGGARAELVAPFYKDTGGLYVMPYVGDTVSISHVKLRNNAGFALWIDNPLSVTKVEAIDFDTGSVHIPTSLVATLGNTTAGSIRLHGTSDESVVLNKRTWIFDRSVGIYTKTTPTTFEIEKGSIVKVSKGGSISVNGNAAAEGKLVAREVLFTSNEAAPAPGDWSGLTFQGHSAADIDGSTFEFAGTTSKSPSGAIVLRARDEKKLRIVNNTFRNNTGAAFEAMEDCKPWEDPALKNTSTTKLCEESPFFKSMKVSTASILALIGSPPKGSLGSTGSVFGPGKYDSIGMLDVDDKAYGSGYAGSGGVLGGGGGAIGLGGLGTKATTSSKVVESSITASGALPVDVVRKAVRGRIGSLRSCHSSGSGTITISFAIDDKGAVTSAKASGGSLTDASTRSCVEGVFRGMTFPAPESSGATSATATHDYSM